MTPTVNPEIDKGSLFPAIRGPALTPPANNEDPTPSKRQETLWAEPLLGIIENFRVACGPDVTSNTIATFLHVALYDGLWATYSQNLLGLKHSGTNQIIKSLLAGATRSGQGAGLVREYPMLRDGRYKELQLTNKGEHLLTQVRFACEALCGRLHTTGKSDGS